MAKTPEGKVKQEIDAYLTKIGAFYRKPVITTFGPRLVDYPCCCYKGRFIAIEAKRPGGKPTRLQIDFLVGVYKAGGIAVVADCVEDVDYAITKSLANNCAWISDSLEPWLDE